MVTRRVRPRGDEIDEGPSDEDLDTFGGVTRPCPECGTDLYDDAEVCWKCGHALSGETKGPPMWVPIVAVLLLVAIIVYWVF